MSGSEDLTLVQGMDDPDAALVDHCRAGVDHPLACRTTMVPLVPPAHSLSEDSFRVKMAPGLFWIAGHAHRRVMLQLQEATPLTSNAELGADAVLADGDIDYEIDDDLQALDDKVKGSKVDYQDAHDSRLPVALSSRSAAAEADVGQ